MFYNIKFKLKSSWTSICYIWSESIWLQLCLHFLNLVFIFRPPNFSSKTLYIFFYQIWHFLQRTQKHDNFKENTVQNCTGKGWFNIFHMFLRQKFIVTEDVLFPRCQSKNKMVLCRGYCEEQHWEQILACLLKTDTSFLEIRYDL